MSKIVDNARPAWKEPPALGHQVTKAVVIGVISLAIVIPLLIVVSTSLAGDDQIIKAGGYVLFPTHPTLKSYQTLFSGGVMFRAVGVSIFITVIGTLIALFVTITMAYATSRPVMFGRPALFLVLFTLLFAPV